MNARAAITVYRPREDVERLWKSPEHRDGWIDDLDPTVTFKDAPGDRGTEVHVELPDGGGVLSQLTQRLAGAPREAKVKDELRRFKQRVETGIVPRSEGAPEGERAERKLKQRPAQPLDESELAKAGAS